MNEILEQIAETFSGRFKLDSADKRSRLGIHLDDLARGLDLQYPKQKHDRLLAFAYLCEQMPRLGAMAKEVLEGHADLLHSN